MVMKTRGWVALVLVLVVSGRVGALYVWDGEQWRWEDPPPPEKDTEEGSGDEVVATGIG